MVGGMVESTPLLKIGKNIANKLGAEFNVLSEQKFPKTFHE